VHSLDQDLNFRTPLKKKFVKLRPGIRKNLTNISKADFVLNHGD